MTTTRLEAASAVKAATGYQRVGLVQRSFTTDLSAEEDCVPFRGPSPAFHRLHLGGVWRCRTADGRSESSLLATLVWSKVPGLAPVDRADSSSAVLSGELSCH